ncbi:MAG: DUF488 domain-containing protein [Thiofilum sp.]|uniref:DUF488 domain-containing protein n=1 Tax=Thiofilum sp. TaxID=2212733 RepID=UPI0025F18602|nr:DUF488 domain-containing protein [Thiofilum sp.]MBK8453089.1 DUF488 domain-containing protein [Thiofilum sp.]
MNIFTIGYEGANIDDFIATLKVYGIDTLLDVREIAMSRRKGFAKTALRNCLEAHGIYYQHEKQLGSPKDIRDRLRADGNYEKYFADFNDYLETQTLLLKNLTIQLKGNVALMCYERDYKTCHRSSVATKLTQLIGGTPKHLGVRHGISIRVNQRMDFSQSLSAA